MSKNPQGRPTEYSQELAEEICEEIANSTKGIMPLCEDNPQWPHFKTIRRWIRQKPGFCSMYAKAKLHQADLLADQCLEIADDTSNDYIVNKNGDMVCNNEFINRSRLRVDTRKWLAAKLAPRTYGERLTNETTITLDETSQKVKENLSNYE